MDSKLLKPALCLPGLVAIGVFLSVLGAGFVYDDIVLLRDNPFMHSWKGIIEAFKLPYWQISGDERVSTGYYRPIGGALLVLLYQIGDGSPFFFHLASILLHGACSVLVASLALRLSWPTSAAWAAGLLFAVHGAHVETVAWISAIPDLLATMFCLLAIRQWLSGGFIWAAVWLGCGLISKEASIGVGIFFFFDALRRKEWKQSFPPLAMAAGAVWLMRAIAFQSPLAGLDIAGTHFMLGPWHTALMSLGLIAKYVSFLFWPWPHSPFPALNVAAGPTDFSVWAPALAGVFLLTGIARIWWKKSREHAWVRVALGLCFAALLPVLNTKMLGVFPFQERYLYLSSVGFCLAVAWLMFGRPRRTKKISALFGTLVLLQTSSTLLAIPKWKNETVFFNWACQQSPESMVSWMGAGRVALENSQGAYEGTKTRIQQAVNALKFYQRALKVDSAVWMVSRIDREYANTGQGDALFLAGDYPQAELVYQETLRGYPESAAARIGLAHCKTRRGEELTKSAREKGSQSEVKKARRLWEESLTLYEEAAGIFSSLVVPIHGQGACLAFLGRLEEALPFLEKAFSMEPANFEFGRGLAEVQATLFRFHFARQTLEELLSHNPGAPWAMDVRQTVESLRVMQSEFLKEGTYRP